MPQGWLAFDTSWTQAPDPVIALFVMVRYVDEDGTERTFLEDVPLNVNKFKVENAGYRIGAGGTMFDESTFTRQDGGSWLQTVHGPNQGRTVTYHFLTLDLYEQYFPDFFELDFRSTEDLQAYIVKFNEENIGIT